MSYILAGILWNDDGTMATATTKDPLEALEELRYRITNFNGKFHNYNELMGTIEAALKRLEGYESHTALTMVNQINALRDENEELRKRLNEMYELREKYRSDEKKLKAYEIIINNFDFDFDDETLTISMPYDLCENDVEEYELLKETLCE